MKRTVIAALFTLSLSLAAAAPQDEPINKTCPMMKGKPVKPGITSQYNGKTIAFC